MNLSDKALKDLRIALKNDIAPQYYEQLTDEDVRNIGNLVMTVMVTSLKIKRSLFKEV